MKIAIDLNDVIRDFSNNFLRYYIERYNHEFDLDEFEFWTNRLGDIFPFNSEAAYHNFLYNDFAFEFVFVVNSKGIICPILFCTTKFTSAFPSD